MATLSGGQQRRALIARALAAEADVLVLDEPLAGVDHESQQGVAETLTGLVEGGTTVVVVLHELGPLEPLITRVVWLDHGAGDGRRRPRRPARAPAAPTPRPRSARRPDEPTSRLGLLGLRADMDLLDYDFMRRALVAAVLVGLAAPPSGCSSCSAG